MPVLTVPIADLGNDPITGLEVRAYLVDIDGNHLSETANGVLILSPNRAITDGEGQAQFNLVANSSVDRVGTYYAIDVAGPVPPVLIEMPDVDATLEVARVFSPAALGTAVGLRDLSDVNDTGLISGQVLQWNGSYWVPVDWVEGGGGGGAPAAHATSHISGSDQLSDATGTTHGLMTAAQFTKLSGIEAGATADLTAAEILALLLTVDTNTSGLNADTLDGLQATAFEAAGAASTAVSGHVAATDPHGDRAYADAAINALVSGAPGLLNTLDELAAALGDDPNFATTITSALAGKQAAATALTQIAALAPGANDIIQFVGGVWASRTMAQLKTALAITQSDVSGLTAALAALQPLDSDLTTIAGLTATTDNVIQSVGSAWASRTPAQLKATLALVKGDVGLANVDNTSDASKPVSTAQQTALDLKANARMSTRVATGTTDTAVLADAQNLIECSNAAAIAASIPLNSSVAYPIGTELYWMPTSTGQITVGGSVTLRAPGGAKSRAQWSLIGARKRATDEWVMFGDTTT